MANPEEWYPYKFLWSRWGGRPWTHIIRDFSKNNIGIVIIVIVALTLCTSSYIKNHWKAVLINTLIVALLTHFFW